MCVCASTSVVDSGVKRKMSSSLVLERWVVVCHRCWELNSGPMQEQYVRFQLLSHLLSLMNFASSVA